MTTLHSPLPSGGRGTRTRHISLYFEFQPLSGHEWRIVDSRLPAGSIEALIGFVDWHDGAFFATRMHHPFESVPFATLEAVAAFLAPPAHI